MCGVTTAQMAIEMDDSIDNSISNPDSSQPFREEIPSKGSQVQLTLNLEPGTLLRVNIEAQKSGTTANTENTGEKEVVYRSPGGDILVFISELRAPNGKEESPQFKAKAGLLKRIRTIVGTPVPKLAGFLFAGSGLVYLLIHLIGLLDFPIYFFCDEAASMMRAIDFLSNSFHDFRGDFFPTFFQNGGQFCLGTSVYLQVIVYFLLGKSEWIVRFITVLISLVAVLWLALILKRSSSSPYGGVGFCCLV